MESLPEEVLIPPTPLIALVGDAPFLDVLTFCLKLANSASGVSLRYETVASTSALAGRVRSQPAHDYTSYAPAGLLPSTWLDKHHNRVPSVMVPVFPLTLRTSSTEWAVIEASITASVLSLREFAGGRGTEMQIVLVQVDRDSPSVTGGGAVLATSNSALQERALSETLHERITSLRRRCGLDGAAVCALYRSDVKSSSAGVSPLVEALDISLRDRALSYYRTRGRHTKALLTRVLLDTQVALRARLFFKLAHTFEFRSKAAKALKYYTACYSALCSTLNFFGPLHHLAAEACAVAEWVNYKLMRCYLAAGNGGVVTPAGLSGLSGATAAVMQFQTHARSWEASATALYALGWLSRQYVIAAELLQLNLPRPGPDTKPNHVPEHYYHSAALVAIERRKAAISAGLVTATGGVGANGAFSVAEASKWKFSEPLYVGGPMQVFTCDGVLLNSEAAGFAADAFLAAAEVAFSHASHVTTLIEKAQATAIIDSGRGTAARALANLSADGVEAALSSGSSFAFVLAPGASRARLWRQSLLADELYYGCDVERALRLIIPVAARLRKSEWGSLLMGRVASRVSDWAGALRGYEQLSLVGAFDALCTSAAAVARGEIGASDPLDDFARVDKCVELLTAVCDTSHPLYLPLLCPPNLILSLEEAASLLISPSSFASAVSCEAAGSTCAPPISASATFQQRIVAQGDKLSMRLFIFSLLPKSVSLSSIEVSCACLNGVVGLAESHAYSHVPSAPRFSLQLVSVAVGNSLPPGAVLASEPNKEGVRSVELSEAIVLNSATLIAIVGLSLDPSNSPFCLNVTMLAPKQSPIVCDADSSSLSSTQYVYCESMLLHWGKGSAFVIKVQPRLLSTMHVSSASQVGVIPSSSLLGSLDASPKSLLEAYLGESHQGHRSSLFTRDVFCTRNASFAHICRVDACILDDSKPTSEVVPSDAVGTEHAAGALIARFNVQPDVFAPLLDLAPLQMRESPFAHLSSVSLQTASPILDTLSVVASSFSTLSLGSSSVAGHVRVGSLWSLSVSLRCGAGAGLLRNISFMLAAASSKGIAMVHEASAPNSTLQPSELWGAVFEQSNANITFLSLGSELSFSFLMHALTPGVWPLGHLSVTWSHASSALCSTTLLELPLIAVHDPPIICDIYTPQLPSTSPAGFDASGTTPQLTMSALLTNRTPHFHALEVAAHAPGSLPPSLASPNGAALHSALVQALPPLAIASPSTFSVELLPNATKTVNFSILPPKTYAGPVVLPTLTVRAVEGVGARVEQAKPRLIAVIPGDAILV